MPAEKKYKWYKLAESAAEIETGANGMARMEAGGKSICLVKKADGLAACARKCPHAGGEMADGWLDAQGNIVCPLHKYRFSVTNGRNTSGEGYFLSVYPVETRPDGIFIGIPETNLFGWPK